MLIPVLLYGILARKYGKRHMLDVSSPAEAVRALSANFRGFQQDLMSYKPGFHVFRGRENLSKEQLNQPSSRDAIRFVPVIEAAKSGGILQIIEGIVIIVVSIIYGVYTEDWASASKGIQVGALMLLGGVVQVLFAPPAPSKNAKEDDANNQPSYVFSGPVNTTSQGHNVPVGYGRLMTGSAVISGSITISQIGTNSLTASVDTTPASGANGDGSGGSLPSYTDANGGNLGGILRSGQTIEGPAPAEF